MSNPNSPLPLSGIRVLDLSRVLAGPTCAMALGDLGAEVIKLEHPERGDDTREWALRPGWSESPFFRSANRNKRSVAVNLQSSEGQRIARELARQCDVVIQNFKFGGADKLGLGFEQLASEHPGLIYCSISGYDRSGSEASRPGYDLVVQGEAGLMALNGEADQPPLKFGVAVVDLVTGMYSAQGILAALYEREKTGRGRHIEMALFDCGVMLTSYCGLDALMMNSDPLRYGNKHPSIIPYGLFDAEDGPVVITVGNDAQYSRFCLDVIERPDLADDSRFQSNSGRSTHRAALMPELEREIGARSRRVLLKRMEEAGIPCGEVFGVHEALTSRRVNDAGLVAIHADPSTGNAPLLAPPYRFDGLRSAVRHAPPSLGEATEEVLQSLLGLSIEQIAELRSYRAI